MAGKQKQKLLNYYKELPQGFKEDYRIDAKNKSVGILLNVIAGVVALIAIFVCWVAKYGFKFIEVGESDFIWWVISLFVFAVAILLYLVLHELTHGLFYKLLTRQKLKFGITLTVAYCGLREGYVNKKTALLAMLAPFVLHSIWMIIAICFIPSMVWSWWLIIVFGFHLGGCCGDLWGTFILIFKYRGKSVLLSDDGPCQVFYTYSGEDAPQPQPEVITVEAEKEV